MDEWVGVIFFIVVLIVGTSMGINIGQDYLKDHIKDDTCFVQNKIVYCK